MRKPIILLTLLALSLGLSQGRAQTVVKGIVRDSISGEAEPFATVRLFADGHDDKPVAMSVTDVDGHIRQETDAKGKHTVVVTSVGKKEVRRHVDLGGQPVVDLGVILVGEDATALAGVEIVAHKPLVKMETDKMSYQVENDPDAKSQTLLDMLRKVPMVTVDAQDNITVNGASSFKVYTDGKPNPMMSANPSQVFKSIPASMVKSVEVVTNPGARYDAEGAAGVLNIIMQHDGAQGSAVDRVNGYSGSATASADTRGGYGGGMFLNAKQGRLTASANGFYNYQRLHGTEVDVVREQYSDMGTSYTEYHQESGNNTPFAMANVTLGYEVDSMSSVNAQLGLTRFTAHNDGHPTTRLRGGAYADGYSYSNTTETDNTNQSFTGTIDYQRFFNHERTRHVTISYQLSHSPSHNESRSIFDPVTGNVPFDLYDRYSDDHQKTLEHTAQIDYSTPLAPKHGLSMGGKFANRNNSADSKYYLDDVYSQQLSSDYHHRNNIAAAYAEYDGHWGKWGTKAGVRYEHTWQNVEYRLGQGDDFARDYGTLVPTATLSYAVAPTRNLGLSYNMRISRPGISYLNPYVNRADPTALSYGNPDLDVEKTHNVNLVANAFSAKWMVNATLRHAFCDNAIEQYSFYDAQGLLNTTYGNVVKKKTTSLNAFINWSATRDTRLMLNGGVGYTDLRSGALDLKNHGWTYNVMANAQQKLPWQVNGSLFFVANSKSYSLQGWSSGFGIVGCNFSKDIVKDKLSVSIMGATGLHSGGQLHFDTHSRSHDFSNTQLIRVPIRQLSLRVNYNFGNLKRQFMQHQSKVDNDYIEQRNDSQVGGIGGVGQGGAF